MATLTDLIAKHPNDGQQAMADPTLRDWFVARAMKTLSVHTTYERAAISYVIDRRPTGMRSKGR